MAISTDQTNEYCCMCINSRPVKIYASGGEIVMESTLPEQFANTPPGPPGED